MMSIQSVIENLPLVHAVEHHCTFGQPRCDSLLLSNVQLYRSPRNHGTQNWFNLVFQSTHPAVVTFSTYIANRKSRIDGQPFLRRLFISMSFHRNLLDGTFSKELQHPLRPYVLLGVDASITKNTDLFHGDLAANVP